MGVDQEFEVANSRRVRVLVSKADVETLYIANKRIQDDKGRLLLSPGSPGGGSPIERLNLSGEEIHRRLHEIRDHEIAHATALLNRKTKKLELDSGPAYEAKRIRFEMEANADWASLEAGVQKLLP